MPKLLTAFAIATMVIATSGVWKANAATITNAGTLAPLTKSYTPAEKIAYWRRQYRRAYRRGYYGYRLRLPVLWLCLPNLPVLRLRLQTLRLLSLRLAARNN